MYVAYIIYSDILVHSYYQCYGIEPQSITQKTKSLFKGILLNLTKLINNDTNYCAAEKIQCHLIFV